LFTDTGRALVVTSSRRAIAETIVRADGALARGLGLVVLRLRRDQALWLEPCNGVHTLFLRYPIDVLVLDHELRVVALRADVRPWRLVSPVRGGRITVELAAGTLAAYGVRVGDTLALASPPD
jgi:uncharacterized membrane protein (UPF0127 family)